MKARAVSPRLLGQRDDGDARVAEAVAAAQARFEQARTRNLDRIALARDAANSNAKRTNVEIVEPPAVALASIEIDPAWKLQPRGERLLRLICARAWISRSMLYGAWMGVTRVSEEERNVLTYALSDLRKRVAPFGLIVPSFGRDGFLKRMSLTLESERPGAVRLTPDSWRLTYCEEVLLSLLVRQAWPSIDALAEAFRAAQTVSLGKRDAVSTLYLNIRRKLGAIGAAIADRGTGWAAWAAGVERVELPPAMAELCPKLFEASPS